jgi:hypothetical protein
MPPDKQIYFNNITLESVRKSKYFQDWQQADHANDMLNKVWHWLHMQSNEQIES